MRGKLIAVLIVLAAMATPKPMLAVKFAPLTDLFDLAGKKPSKQRPGLRIIGTPPSNDRLTAANFTYLGACQMPSGNWNVNPATQNFAARVVSGTVHFFLSQGDPEDGTTMGPLEVADCATYNTDYTMADTAALVTDWSKSSGSPYDFFHGRMGKTFDGSGSVVNVGGGSGNWLPDGIFFDPTNTAICMSYSVGYASYLPDWGFTCATLDADSPVASTGYGFFRFQTSPMLNGDPPGLGPIHSAYFTIAPNGDVVMGSGSLNTGFITGQNGTSLNGIPAASFPNPSTPSGWGSVRGSNGGRTTDIIVPDDYLGAFTLAGDIDDSGVASVPIWVTRRPPTASTTPPYIFEGYTCIDGSPLPQYQVAPANYGGVGSWTAIDGSNGVAYVSVGSFSNYVYSASVAVKDVWYETKSCLDFYRDSPEETTRNTHDTDPTPNTFLEYIGNTGGVLVTIAYVDPGAINQSPTTVSVSGSAITVHLATNGSGVITSTANQVKAAIDASTPAHALVTVNLWGPSDGTGIVSALSAWKVAGGPWFCPLHNLAPASNNVGPVTVEKNAAFLAYSAADLDAVKNSGGLIPAYTPDPNWIYLTDIYPSIRLAQPPEAFNKGVSNPWIDPATKKLYVLAQGAGVPQGLFKPPLMHVFQLASSIPSPVEHQSGPIALASLGMAGLVALTGKLVGRLSLPVVQAEISCPATDK